MKLPFFEYAAPASLGEAVTLLAKHPGEAKIIAGGQSLLPIMAFRLASPSLLVDIGKIPDLRHITVADDGLHLGPLVRWCDIERSADIAEYHPLLRDTVRHIAHYQVRNRGTVGGSLAHADPAAEFPCVVVTCGATITLSGEAGSRQVKADQFILGELETALLPDEIITDIHFPAWPKERRSAFIEFSKRRGDFALGGVATFLDLDKNGRISNCAIGVLGVASRATRLPEVEAILRGEQPSPAVIQAAAKAARDVVSPPEDIHASQNYRRALLGTLVGRALTTALDLPRPENAE